MTVKDLCKMFYTIEILKILTKKLKQTNFKFSK